MSAAEVLIQWLAWLLFAAAVLAAVLVGFSPELYVASGGIP